MGTHTSLAVCTLAVNWTLTLLAFLAVICNCWHKFAELSMRIGPDDILIVLSFVIGTVLVSLSTWTILDEGQGEHQQDVSANQLEKAAKVSILHPHSRADWSLLVSEALWTLVTGLLRTAACLLIYRIFCVSTQTRRTAIAIMALSAALAAASIIQIFLICKPFAAQWDPRVLGSCGDQVASFLVFECTGMLLDVGILLLPTATIRQSRVPRIMKFQSILVCNIGALVLVISGLRMAALRSAVSPDFTYSQSYLSLLSAAGCMAGIICCGSPAIWAIFRRITGGRRGQGRPPHGDGLQGNGLSDPTAKRSRGTRTQPGQEMEGKDCDVKKGSDASTGTGEVEELSRREDITTSEQTLPPPAGEVSGMAMALFNFHPRHVNELPLKEGQLIWVHHRVKVGWLVAQNWRSNEE